jgi:hypothetical protein
MSIDYFEELFQVVEQGADVFACPTANPQEWDFSTNIHTLRKKAQRGATVRHIPLSIYRLVSVSATDASGFLIIRRILKTTLTGVPPFHCSIVETRDAAELPRDVSQGPTPYFGVVVEETLIT